MDQTNNTTSLLLLRETENSYKLIKKLNFVIEKSLKSNGFFKNKPLVYDRLHGNLGTVIK